jgi:signal transduction histidine kinase
VSHLFSMRASTLIAICGVTYLLAAGQSVHACFASTRRGGGPRRLRVWYEAMVSVHLLLACAVSSSAMENQGVILLWLHPVVLRVESLLWANALAAALGGALAVRLRRPWMAAEVALIACCTPPVVEALGEGSSLLLIADASLFAARVPATLALDVRESRASVSRLSLVDALDALPEGVMWTNEDYDVLFMNDAMRASLTSLGLSTDLADARGLWERLEARAREAMGDGLLVDVGGGRTCLFVRDRARLRGTPCERVMALDVSEEAATNARLESLNRLLEAANEELRASMLQVRRVAEAEAIMRMRARVHDTIGARLSILHRFLEDDRDDPEALERICGLLNGIVDDLAETDPPAASAGLESIRIAFSLVGVDVRVTGELPADEEVARAFAEIALEAVTNAAKHSQARRVDVRVCRGPGGAASLSVTNDGCAPGDFVEGTGIPGMRRAAAAVGASFAVRGGPPFSVEVVLPAGAAPAAGTGRPPTAGTGATAREAHDERGQA